jgi:hypothetical protein
MRRSTLVSKNVGFICLQLLAMLAAAAATSAQTLPGATIDISELSVPSAVAGAPYATVLHAKPQPSGSAVTWSLLSPLPPGLSFLPSGTTATISGTTAQLGAHSITVVASILGGTVFSSRTMDVFVNPAGSTPPSFNLTLLDTARAGDPYTSFVGVSGGQAAYTFSRVAGTLPDGLSFVHNGHAPIGSIVGTPSPAASQAVPYRFAYRVEDQSDLVQYADLSLSVLAAAAAAPLHVTTLVLPIATEGASYSAPLVVENALPGTSHTWSVIQGSLPSGLLLVQPPAGQSAAQISGTPLAGQAATWSLVVRVQGGTRTAHAFYRLRLNDAGAAITFDPPVLADAEEAYFYSQYVTAAGGVGAYQYSQEAGVLPPGLFGLHFLTPYSISGTPGPGSAARGPYSFAITAIDATGRAGTHSYTVNVIPPGLVTIDQGASFSHAVDEESSGTFFLNQFRLSATDHDAPEASLSWSIAAAPAHGTAWVVSGNPSSPEAQVTCTYEPQSGFSGTDTFTIEVDDGDGHTDQIAVSVSVQGFSNVTTWGKLNGGRPIGERYPDSTGSFFFNPCFDLVPTAPPGFPTVMDGALVYSLHSPHLGRYLGRLTTAGAWELLGPGGWSADPAVVPISIGHVHNRYGQLDLVPHPDVPGGLIGVVRQNQGIGHIEFDTHGHTSSILFDGSEWKSWAGGTNFDVYRSQRVLGDFWNVGGGESTFAFDPVNREGIAVGLASTWEFAQLSAARIDLDDPSTTWRRWIQEPGGAGQWHSGVAAPSRDSFILDSHAPGSTGMRGQQIVHLPGTRTFLCLFRYGLRSGNSDRLAAARYDGAAQHWSWWDGAAWQPADQNTQSYIHLLGNVTPALGEMHRDWTITPLTNGDALIVFAQDGLAYEVVYDVQNGVFSTPAVIGAAWSTSSGKMMGSGMSPAGVAWMAYSDDAIHIHVRKRWGAGLWSPGELVCVTPESFDVLAVGFSATRPVVFYREYIAETGLVHHYALGEYPAQNWSHETPLDLTPLPPRETLAGATAISVVLNSAPSSAYGAQLAIGLDMDSDGYLYAPCAAVCKTIVHPPSIMPGTGFEENHAWGSFWDHFPFPGQVAVWPEGKKTFIPNDVVADAAGGQTDAGNLSVWDMPSRRDQSYGWQVIDPNDPPPLGFIADYSPQIVRPSINGDPQPLRMPLGAAINRQNGLLVVTSSVENRLAVYDALNLHDEPDTFSWHELLFRITQPHQSAIAGICNALVQSGSLSGPLTSLTWLATDLELVLDEIRATPEFADLGLGGVIDQEDCLRHFARVFKERHDLPTYLYSFGALGSAAGQFRFPAALAFDGAGRLYVVDSENCRVQRFNVSAQGMTFDAQFGTRGRGPGELLYPTSISVSGGEAFVVDPYNDRVVVFSTVSGAFLYEFSSYTEGSSTVFLDHLSAVHVTPDSIRLSHGRVDGRLPSIITLDR